MRIPIFETVTCTHQAFDSEAFEGPVLRLGLGEGPDSQVDRDLKELVDYARVASVKLISCRITHDNPLSVSLEAAGFRQVEELVVYGRTLPERGEYESASMVGAAGEGDREACERLAGDGFTHDRYHADPDIDDVVADRIKRMWVRNSFAGRADRIWVARRAAEVVGFIICLKNEVGSYAAIDLIAVSERNRGQGIGKALVAAAIDHYAGNLASIQAGTQTRNVTSCRLYSALGFSVQGRWRTYHLLPSGKVRA